MASSSGNSSDSPPLQSSGAGEDLHRLMDQRKRKRMQSNRESARRSRMRKQQHLADLKAQVSRLRRENNQILSDINVTTQHYLNVEAENKVLSAQTAELSRRLQSLNEIHDYMNAGDGGFDGEAFQSNADNFMNPWSFFCTSHPIAAAADISHC